METNRYIFLLQRFKYELLLSSLLLFLFGDIIHNDFFNEHYIVNSIKLLNLLFGINVIHFSKPKTGKILFISIVVMFTVEIVFHSSIPNVLKAIDGMFIAFYLYLTYEVIAQVIKAKEVDRSTIIGSICGLLLFGIMGALGFILIETEVPHSFNNLAQKEIQSDLLYHSFITLLSVGYGDITPSTMLAKKAAMLVGLFGQLYLSILIAMLVGKFLTNNKNSIGEKNNPLR